MWRVEKEERGGGRGKEGIVEVETGKWRRNIMWSVDEGRRRGGGREEGILEVEEGKEGAVRWRKKREGSLGGKNRKKRRRKYNVEGMDVGGENRRRGKQHEGQKRGRRRLIRFYCPPPLAV